MDCCDPSSNCCPPSPGTSHSILNPPQEVRLQLPPSDTGANRAVRGSVPLAGHMGSLVERRHKGGGGVGRGGKEKWKR